MEPASGVEPPTYGLRNRCSATELRRLSKGSVVRTEGLPYQNQPPSYFVRYPLSTRSGLSFASNPTSLASLYQHYIPPLKPFQRTYFDVNQAPLYDIHHTILTTISLYSLFKRCCVNRVRPKGFHLFVFRLNVPHPLHTVYPERR